MSKEYDGYDADSDVGDPAAEEWVKQRVWEDSQMGARLLGAGMREPTVAREILQVGATENDWAAPSLRHAFIGMRQLVVEQGRCSETSLLHYLEIVLPDPAHAQTVIAFCLKTSGVRRLDDVGLLLAQMREKIGRRRLEQLLFTVSRGTRGDTPLVDLVSRTRRELEHISMASSSVADGWSGAELAEMGRQFADGSKAFPTVRLGLPSIDDALGGGARQGSIVLVIAGTGTGKTTYAIHFATTAARGGFGVLYICLEDPPQTSKALNMNVQGCRLPIPKEASAKVWTDAHNGRVEMATWPSFRMTFERPLTVEAIGAKIHARKRTHRVDLVVVDYVQRIRKSTRFGGVADVEHISDSLLNIAGDENVAMVLMSQVSAAGRERVQQKNATLSAEDSAGGVQFANDAAGVLTIERKREEKDQRKANVSTVSLRKNRDFGTAAEDFMKWDRITTRLTPCGKDGDDVVEIPEHQGDLPFDHHDEPAGLYLVPPGGSP